MLSIILDPAVFQSAEGFSAEIRGFIEHVKSSRTVTPDGEILMPGEPEARSRARKLRDGIEIDQTTWGQIVATADSLGVPDRVDRAMTALLGLKLIDLVMIAVYFAAVMAIGFWASRKVKSDDDFLPGRPEVRQGPADHALAVHRHA